MIYTQGKRRTSAFLSQIPYPSHILFKPPLQISRPSRMAPPFLLRVQASKDRKKTHWVFWHSSLPHDSPDIPPGFQQHSSPALSPQPFTPHLGSGFIGILIRPTEFPCFWPYLFGSFPLLDLSIFFFFLGFTNSPLSPLPAHRHRPLPNCFLTLAPPPRPAVVSSFLISSCFFVVSSFPS